MDSPHGKTTAGSKGRGTNESLQKNQGDAMTTEIRIEPRDDYVEVTAKTEIVNSSFWILLLEKVAQAIRKYSKRKVLLEVEAPDDDMALESIRAVWTYALARGMGGVRISHLIKGRPIGPNASFKESVAINRGIMLQTFNVRKDALGWLKTN
jgi:hypothetical protein